MKPLEIKKWCKIKINKQLIETIYNKKELDTIDWDYLYWKITTEDTNKPICIHWKYFSKEELLSNKLIEILWHH